MWLPKEERHLLMVYTVFDPNFDGQDMVFKVEDLKWALDKCLQPSKIVKRASELRKEAEKQDQKVNTLENTQTDGNKKVEEYMSWLRAKATIRSINNRLRARGLIESRECDTGCYEVKMTLAGWDLGDKYNSWCSRNVLWFREYKDHWIWLIVGFLGGIVGALLVNWLSNGNK